MTVPVLQFDDFSLAFPTPAGPLQALSHVSLAVMPGEIVGLVGESGSGKSVTAMSAMRLLPRGGYQVTGGRLRVLAHDVMALDRAALEQLRGGDVGMVFQEPMNALNPVLRIGAQVTGVIRRHRQVDAATARRIAIELLQAMAIDNAEAVMRLYPSALSGGMRQRVLLAMAFAGQPKLLIADEPTTALDVTVQAQVLALIRDHARRVGAAVLFISHDLAVVGQLCDRLYVLYAGTVVESGPTAALLTTPRHPYTRALLAALPDGHAPRSTLAAIGGSVPSLLSPPPGCRFAPRCAHASARCDARPALLPVDAPHDPGSARALACWHPDGAAKEGVAP